MWKSISNFFNQIAKDQLSAEFAKKAAKDAKEIDQLQKKSDQKKADIKAQLLKTYGSMDKVPRYIKTDLKSILGEEAEDKWKTEEEYDSDEKKSRQEIAVQEKKALYQANKEKERQKKRRQEKATKKTEFIEKYGKELGTKIAKGELWIGMSKEALMAIKGRPGKKIETISRNKKREEYFFDGNKNRQGNMSFKLKVILIDGLVEKWAIG